MADPIVLMVNKYLYVGLGVPTHTAKKGALYIRKDGVSAATMLYTNTDGGTSWSALSNTTTAAKVVTAAGQTSVIDALLSATGEALVKVADNLANAFEIIEGTTSYLKAVTTNGAEKLSVGVGLVLAAFLTLSVGASTAAAGNAVGNAGALPAGTASVYPTTAADDTKGVVIHANDQVTGRILFIGNGVSNKILKVYGPSGAAINGAAADAAFSGASGKGIIMICLSGVGNTWFGF